MVLVLLIAGCTSAPAPTPPPPITADQVDLEVEMSDSGIAWAQVGSGPPLLLLNGTASPMSQWDPAFLAALAQRRRVIVVDYPGLGASTARLAPTFAGMADQISQFLKEIGVARTEILGWSMGGFIAQQLLLRDPQTIAGAVLVGTNPGGTATTLGPPWVQQADSDPDAGIGTYLRTNYPPDNCAQNAGQAFLGRLEAAAEEGRYPDDVVPDKTYDTMVAAEDPWLRSPANIMGLSRVDKPVLVMVGSRDVVTPPANSRLIAAAVARSQLTIVEGAGHSVLFQDPSGTARLVTDFLDSGKAPATTGSGCD